MSRKMEDRAPTNTSPAGYAVKQLRLRKNMSQTTLAKAAGVTVVTVCHIERGRSIPSLGTVEKLGRVLGPLALQSEIAAEMRRRGMDDGEGMAQHAHVKAAQVAAVGGEGDK